MKVFEQRGKKRRTRYVRAGITRARTRPARGDMTRAVQARTHRAKWISSYGWSANLFFPKSFKVQKYHEYIFYFYVSQDEFRERRAVRARTLFPKMSHDSRRQYDCKSANLFQGKKQQEQEFGPKDKFGREMNFEMRKASMYFRNYYFCKKRLELRKQGEVRFKVSPRLSRCGWNCTSLLWRKARWPWSEAKKRETSKRFTRYYVATSCWMIVAVEGHYMRLTTSARQPTGEVGVAARIKREIRKIPWDCHQHRWPMNLPHSYNWPRGASQVSGA